jgi:lipopolysaccharide transport system ATP-binding protein
MSFENLSKLKPLNDAPNLAIEAVGLGKCYDMFQNPSDRLKQLMWGRLKNYSRPFWALQDVNLQIGHGEVVGLIGRNGAGKSTLLQMLCGTLPHTSGSLKVNGRVAALLELGAGFNPEFTGIENVYMNGALMGLTHAQVQERLPEILAFADIGDFVHQPVKTYSSGMFMRLAFAVATSVEPDILVIDEALSVGDGAFARKSFERIMKLKDAGKTILFCSHSMYQVEALCSRAVWLEAGRVRMAGSASDVTQAYNESLALGSLPEAASFAGALIGQSSTGADAQPKASDAPPPTGSGHIVRVTARSGSQEALYLNLKSGISDLTLDVDFRIDPELPAPGLAFGFSDGLNQTIASVISIHDGVKLTADAQGRGKGTVTFPKIPLLKGEYAVTVFLSTEDALHPYDQVTHCVKFRVTQDSVEQGIVTLPHSWHTS